MGPVLGANVIEKVGPLRMPVDDETVQRVWQYLRRFNRDPDEIQEFEFDPQKTEGTPLECLKTLIRFVYSILFFLRSISL